MSMHYPLRMTKNMKPIFCFALALCLVACTSDQITQTLEAAASAAIVAAEIAAPQDIPYLTQAQGCLDAAESTLLNTTLSNLTKSATIAAECAQAAAAGQNAPVAVQAVVAALNAFLASVNQIQPVIAAHAEVQTGHKLDRKKLDRIRVKLALLHQKLAAAAR